MADVLERIRRAGRPPFYRMSAPEARDACVAASEILELPRAPLARVEDADKLRAAGVNVELQLCRGVTHAFIKMGRSLREADQAQTAIAAALNRAIATP